MKRHVYALLPTLLLMTCPMNAAMAQTASMSGASAGKITATRPQLSGERLFIQCRACHSLTGDHSGKVGPALSGLFTRGAGRVAGFDYSPGMRAYGGMWTDARLDAFLAGPNRTIAGTKMAFVGIPDGGRRAALIAYLRANTGSSSPTK